MTLVLGPGNDILLEVMGDGFTSVDGGGGFNTLNADWSAATTGVSISTGVTGLISSAAAPAQFSFTNFNVQNFKTGSGDDFFSWAYAGAPVTFSFDGGGGVNGAALDFGLMQTGVSFAFDATPGAISNVFGSTLKNVQNVQILGTDFDDTLGGGAGADFLAGRAGHNALSGGGGDDQFLSDGAVDTIDGGIGINRWIGLYSVGAQPNLTFSQTGSRAYALSNGTTLANIDGFDLRTGDGDDTFNLTTITDGSLIQGGAGTNTFNLNISGASHGIRVSADSGSVVAKDIVTGAQMTAASVQQSSFVTGSGADVFSLWALNQTANGGAGDDSAIYRGPRSAYLISTAGGVTTVKDLGSGFNDGTDTLTNIEHLNFADQVVDLPPPVTTLAASAPSAGLVEAGVYGAGVSSSTASLTPVGGSGAAAYVLTGWTAKGGGLYSHGGTYGSAVLDTVHNSLTYTLNNALAATNVLKSGQAVSDGFTIKVTDGSTSASASVGFSITGANDNPLAKADQATAHYGAPLLLQASMLLANDSDPEGDALAISSVGSAQHGTASLSGGQVTFTPYVGYVGAAQFSYTVSDGHGGTATGAVAVKVLSAAGTSLGPVSVSVAGAATGQTVDVSGDGQGHQVTGSGFNDFIYGGAQTDTLNGGAGNDLINGGGGADLIAGGTGNDALTGGAGADSFIWAAADVINAPAGTQDTILDFEGAGDGATSGDLLIFNGLSAGSTLTLTSHSTVDPHLYTYTLTNFATGCAEAIVIHSVDGRALTAGDFLFH